MVIVCDCHYRSSITAIRSFYNEGEDVIAVSLDSHKNPPSFSSKYVKDKFVLSSDKETYTEELLSLCRKYNNPIIFPTGNFTLNVLSENLDTFSEFARFCVSSPQKLQHLNDKKWVKNAADTSGLKVPKTFSIDTADTFPLVVKPYCGEKFNLKASERYKIVYDKEQLADAVKQFKKFDENPIIEEFVEGQGVGVSFVLNGNSQAQSAFCHKRIIEYPISGGPSAYLTTFFDKELVDSTKNFLENIGFVGIAMVEYKCTENGFYLLEINPRVWGSFPSTEAAKSDFIKSYIRACDSANSEFTCKYDCNKKVKFTRGMIMACLSYLKKKKVKQSLEILGVILSPRIPDATFSFKDIVPSIRDFFRR